MYSTNSQYRSDTCFVHVRRPGEVVIRRRLCGGQDRQAWTQTLNFIVVGLLTLAFAVGLVRLRGARHKSGNLGRYLRGVLDTPLQVQAAP
jgi:hypothetical protein